MMGRKVMLGTLGIIAAIVILSNILNIGDYVTNPIYVPERNINTSAGNIGHTVGTLAITSRIDTPLLTEKDVSHICQYTKKINVTMEMISDLNSTKHNWYPKTEDMVKRCQSRDWGDVTTFPTLGVVVTFGDHESVYNILHTVHALVERTPAQVLKEIVIVDDNSTKDEHKELMSNYLLLAFGNLVKIHRSTAPLGLMGARKTGGLLVTADVIAFFDSHMEVQPGWAEPLLLEIVRNPKTMAVGCMDWMEKKGSTWEYIHGAMSWVTVFDWDFDFQFQDINTEKVLNRPDPTESFSSPMTMGSIYALRRDYFSEIGSFDDGMKFWGGENIDLSLRVWMCGGQILVSPCSRAAHLEGPSLRAYRSNYKDYSQHNYKRVAEVWLDEYKELFYRYKPTIRSLDVGSLEERREIRKRCPRNFAWYLQNGFPQLGVPDDGFAFNGVKNKKYGGCLDTLQTRVVGLHSRCDPNAHHQAFYWDKSLNLRFPLHIFNMDNLSDVKRKDKGLRFGEYLVYHNTSWPRSQYIHWKGGPIIEVKSLQCLEAVTNTIVGFRNCENKEEQMWTFTNYSSAYDSLMNGSQEYISQYKMGIKVQKEFARISNDSKPK